jgi:hypothetical protein
LVACFLAFFDFQIIESKIHIFANGSFANGRTKRIFRRFSGNELIANLNRRR